MTGSDIFYYVASLGIVVITGVVSLTCFRVLKTLDHLDGVLLGIRGIANEISIIRSGVKVGVFSLISGIANRFRSQNYKSKGVKNND